MNRIQVRRGATADWNNYNPILAQGEITYDTTVRKFKIGNGSDHWADLPYDGSGGTVVVGVKDTSGNWTKITIDGVEGNIPSGGGSSLTAGNGISIVSGIISAKVDNVTIGFDANGALKVKSAGSVAWGAITGDLDDQTDLYQALESKENVSNKKTSLTDASDNTYPTTKCVADNLLTCEEKDNKKTTVSAASTDTDYPSAKAVYTFVHSVVGVLSDLTTTAQSNIVAAINELVTKLNGKQSTITAGTSDPSGGNDGDVYIKYTE